MEIIPERVRELASRVAEAGNGVAGLQPNRPVATVASGLNGSSVAPACAAGAQVAARVTADLAERLHNWSRIATSNAANAETTDQHNADRISAVGSDG